MCFFPVNAAVAHIVTAITTLCLASFFGDQKPRRRSACALALVIVQMLAHRLARVAQSHEAFA